MGKVVICIVLFLTLLPYADVEERSSDSLPPVDPLNMYSSTAGDWDPKSGPYYQMTDELHGFNPWIFTQNAAIACTADAPYLADELTMTLFHELAGGYLVQTYPYRFEETDIEPLWTSGFSNGVALIGASALYECYGSAHHRAVADLLFSGYLRGEFSETLPDGTTWYQEYPIPGSRVLNGHIYAVFGLYYYYHATGNREALPYLLAGLEALAVHGPEYRRTGQVNLYDLLEPDTADYGPVRAIHQQDTLCRITGDPRFLALRDAFASDMPEAAEEIPLLCTREDTLPRTMDLTFDAA